ncbi:myelin expression factor 2 [Bicyclus anynana]|uniref:Myelin expression factor 2 n=1 Tax=Bicyclus anynana TaxID=110368 RepID=A0ABM3LTP8_BICAN|nr:myelin expression factor 2 [Bicyclus anynana]XP_052742435.1 myelin expression factor 2 [Bicyclus anynana]XP_052742436.1 myelin expression factor 2 [Bicyclus anynana]
MDSNKQNNDSDKVPGFDSDEIIQPAARRVSAKEIFSLNLKKEDSKFDCDIQDTQLNPKRKFSEDSNKMENEDSQNSNESVKRRRYSDSLNEVPKSNDSSSLGEKNYTLMITNSPGDWTLDEVMKFVKHECGVESVNDSREKNTGNCQVDLQFDEKEKFYHVLAKLREKEALGKLSVHCIDKTKAEPESDAESAKTLVLENKSSKFKQETREEESAGSSTPDEDFAIDPNEFYLRESYLDTLGIKSPISNWVSVTDFRCDKSELKEVLELAGRVLVCSVSMNTKHASVMYSHPLEAVQAVSMLNGQQYYGKTLQVKMSIFYNTNQHCQRDWRTLAQDWANTAILCKTLANITRDSRKGKPSDLDACLFQTAFLNKDWDKNRRNCQVCLC